MLAACLLLMTLASDSVRFPTLTSSNLEGKTFTMPRDFAGERNVLFIAFLRQQQADVDTWVPFVKPLVARAPDAEYYEIPTIYRMIAPMRWMLNRGMKAGIDDRAARDRTITLYLDKDGFKRSLAIEDEKSIHVMVVDRDGRVLWRTTGSFTEEKGRALEQALLAK